MNQNEAFNVDDLRDAELSAALAALPLPTAAELQQRVRARVRAQFAQRQSIVGLRAAVVVLVLGLFFQIWVNSARQVPPPELSAAELEFLFAPPPVDSLALLDRQQQIAYRIMQRWEPNR